MIDCGISIMLSKYLEKAWNANWYDFGDITQCISYIIDTSYWKVSSWDIEGIDIWTDSGLEASWEKISNLKARFMKPLEESMIFLLRYRSCEY